VTGREESVGGIGAVEPTLAYELETTPAAVPERARRLDWPLIVSGIMVGIVVFITIFGPWMVRYDPNWIDSVNRLMPPFWMEGGSLTHPLGTDGVGRDLLSRIIVAFRTSLIISLAGVLLAVTIGSVIGVASGYLGGATDTVLMAITDIQLSFPFVVLAVSLLGLVSPTPAVLIVVLSLAAWPMYARVVRSVTRQERGADYVVAARSIGVPESRIIAYYIARNIVPPVFLVATLDIATLVVLESLLSFLGLGVQPPTASWGNIIAEGKNYLSSSWWVPTLPGVAIVFTVLGFNLLGDSLHHYIDPRSTRR
jgi:ABC-type dipeptide/oligopeptide/nickel transport system permease subunit